MIDILIPTRFSWDSICLTIESIIKRTSRQDYRIIVADNSLADNRFACEPHARPEIADDGNRRNYLRDLARRPVVPFSYIEVQDQGRCYGHGENLVVLCDASTAPYAMLLNANSEIIRGDWLDVLVDLIKDPGHDLGVARERSDGAREHDYITPTYWPNMMLLNMPLYRKHFAGHKWELRQVGAEQFERAEIFYGQPPPIKPERTPPLVFCDTGWTLWERLHYDNPAGLRMLPLPDNYWNTHIAWRGGIDRNSYRPDHPHVVQTLAEIDRRLKALRAA